MPSRNRARGKVKDSGDSRAVEDNGFKELQVESSATGHAGPSSGQEGAQNHANVLPVEPPSKKARFELEDCHIVPTSSTPEPYIFNLPLEVLGDILVLTGSPRHVLAFTRTCKRFCYTLISQGAAYIWRRARRGSQCTFSKRPNFGVNITMSLPDPPKQFFSEAAYAAFVFDPGACDNCGEKTSLPYASFALRIRICHHAACRRLPDGFISPAKLKSIVPTNEINIITATSESGWDVLYWPQVARHDYFSRETDVWKASDDSCIEKSETRKKRNDEWMMFCSSLAKWKLAFNDKYQEFKSINERLAREGARMFGWEYIDMMGCTVFARFCQQKSKYLEYLNITDVRSLRGQIDSELLALEEKRQRRKTEVALIKNRKDVETLYNRLRSKGEYEYLPSLPTFRQLPVIQLLQSGIYDEESGTTISETLQKNPLMRQQLMHDIKRCIETAKQDLAVMLGFPRAWKSANKRILHPALRPTAWFLCTNCGIDGSPHKVDGCLDFDAACHHVCQSKDGKNDRYRRSKKGAWNPECFVVDEKARDVMKRALSKLKMSEDIASLLHLKQYGFGVLCTSCEPSMVIDSRNLAGHSHRHDHMEFTFLGLPETIQYLNGFRYPYGMVAKLFRQGKKIRDEKKFGCRICWRRKQVDNTPADVPGGSANITGNEGCIEGTQRTMPLESCIPLERPKEMPTLFSFNGMRSHLKAKHKIEKIRDEDLFCSESAS